MNIPASHIVINTDGACSGNPGPGGYGVLLQRMVNGQEVKRLTCFGHKLDTTNNQMELMAVVVALRKLSSDEPVPILIRTDSEITAKGINEWLLGWLANGGRNAKNKPIANWDLWSEIAAMMGNGLNVQAKWVKGHAGDLGNEVANKLAQAERDKAKRLVSKGYERGSAQ